MAVPKKRTSIAKKPIHKNIWKGKGYTAALKIVTIGKFLYKQNVNSDWLRTHPIVYIVDKEMSLARLVVDLIFNPFVSILYKAMSFPRLVVDLIFNPYSQSFMLNITRCLMLDIELPKSKMINLKNHHLDNYERDKSIAKVNGKTLPRGLTPLEQLKQQLKQQLKESVPPSDSSGNGPLGPNGSGGDGSGGQGPNEPNRFDPDDGTPEPNIEQIIDETIHERIIEEVSKEGLVTKRTLSVALVTKRIIYNPNHLGGDEMQPRTKVKELLIETSPLRTEEEGSRRRTISKEIVTKVKFF